MMNYYASLYRPCTTADGVNFTAYFDTFAVLWLEDSHRLFLDAPIDEEDVIRIIQAMTSGNAPSLGGLSMQFYEEYAPVLAPQLCTMYEEALELGVLPLSLREALVATIL